MPPPVQPPRRTNSLNDLWRLIELAGDLATRDDVMENLEQVALLCEDAAGVARTLAQASGSGG